MTSMTITLTPTTTKAEIEALRINLALIFEQLGDATCSDPSAVEVVPSAGEPPAEEPKPKTTRARKRRKETPAAEASPAAKADTTDGDMLNEAVRLLATEYGTKKPDKKMQAILDKYDVMYANEVPENRAADFLADVKAMLGGGEAVAPEKVADEVEDLGI